jgi:valyl-tRNA synthetase
LLCARVCGSAQYVQQVAGTEEARDAGDAGGQGGQPRPASWQPKQLADRWILSRLAGLTRQVTGGIDAFEFGEVARRLYDFFWNEFCDWYIELAKGRLSGSADERREVQQVLVFTLDVALRLLHPFMPFITEEIWQRLPGHDEAALLLVATWPAPETLRTFVDEAAERRIGLLMAVVGACRSTRARYGLSPKEPLAVVVKVKDTRDEALLDELTGQIRDLARASELTVGQGTEKPAHAAVVVEAGLEIYLLLAGLVDFEAERVRLSKERERQSAELSRLSKKLDNPGFLKKAAAAIVDKDRRRAAELSENLRILDAQITELS